MKIPYFRTKYTFLFLLFSRLTVLGQLSPGDLHRSHQAFEGIKNCSLCHGIGQKISAENCLKCHTLLQERIDKNKGLHANPGYEKCQNCHVEHHGRDFELIWWENGQENFDHSLTGFNLNGKHASLKCRECHRPEFILEKEKLRQHEKDLNRTFLGLQSTCLNCHRDEHRTQLSSKCLDCHTPRSWKPATGFNHASADFPLTGKHINVACEKCHPVIVDNAFPEDSSYSKFSGLKYNTCSDCHSDPHKTRFGMNCTGCHTTTGWANYNEQKFNHSMTRFPLEGKHRYVACNKCHPPGNELTKPRFQKCTDCHSDYHLGQFSDRPSGGSCEECHSVNGFRPADFAVSDHDKTDFPLKGAHLAVPCIACHKETYPGPNGNIMRFTFTSQNCQTCHNDPHAGTVATFLNEKGCANCHTVQSWRNINFDHDRETEFSLETAHQKVACIKCHPQNPDGNIPLKTISGKCQSCHSDPHFGQFAEKSGDETPVTECQKCHRATRWTDEKFDHNTQASFKLEGAHQLVKCKKCHPTIIKNGKTFTLYKPIKSECADCHGTKKVFKEENKP